MRFFLMSYSKERLVKSSRCGIKYESKTIKAVYGVVLSARVRADVLPLVFPVCGNKQATRRGVKEVEVY
jgi:hypothetical protein